MAIEYKTGDIFTSECCALVNPVNTVGIMGKGLAKQFKEKYPHNFNVYSLVCRASEIQMGEMFVVCDMKTIINFPTKDHWRNGAKIDWIKEGLKDLKYTIKSLNIPSVALPKIGCGLGGLDWRDVKPLIEAELGEIDCKIEVYE